MKNRFLIIGIILMVSASTFSGCIVDDTTTVEDFVLIISEIYYNSTGNSLNEFIELYVVESDSDSIDISDWYVTTFDGDDELLPSISDLEQFDYISLYMGSGTDDLDASDGSATIYLDRIESMLDILGGEVGLYDSNDELVDFVRYNGGTNISALGGWSPSDSGARASSSLESIQIHGKDLDGSSNWISAPPSPAEPNIDEWLMDADLNLYYQIHNGQNRDVDLTGTPWDDLPEWEIYNESGPVSNEDINTVRSWLNHTYEYMKERGLGTPRTKDTDNKVHVHITKLNKPASGRSTRNGEIYVKIGNLSDRNESIKSKKTVEHEQVHLIQYNNSGSYGPYDDWTDLEGMAEYWGTKIAMSNFNITYDEFIDAYDEVYRKYGYSNRHDRWLKHTDRDYFQKFRRPAHLDWYWANHMFLRFIEEQFGEEKVRHIFKVRNTTSGVVGIINVTNKAFEEQADHNETFDDLFENFTIWLWENFEASITLALNKTFDGNTTISESGSLNPWGIDYEKIINPTDNGTKITFKGDPNKNYSITVIGKMGNDTEGGIEKRTFRFKHEIEINHSGEFNELIIIKCQLNCKTVTNYTMNVSAYTVVNNPPVTPYSPAPSDAETDVSIDSRLEWLCYDPDGDNVTFDVYLGTGSNPPKLASNQTSIIYRPETLSSGTKYYWRIVAWDSHGAKTSGPLWQFTTEAANVAPVVYAFADYDNDTFPLQVNFSVEAFDEDGEIVSYFWDFDDGNTSDEQNPTYIYENIGNYTVILTVTDDDGAFTIVEIIIIVKIIEIE